MMALAQTISWAVCSMRRSAWWGFSWLTAGVMLAAGGVSFSQDAAQGIEEFPRIRIGGHDSASAVLEQMLVEYSGRKTNCALWDAWLPRSGAWMGVGPEATADPFRQYYQQVFRQRRVTGEGYVDMRQHQGLAHPLGWPFPTWNQAGGIGWHFSLAGDNWSSSVGVKVTGSDGWKVSGADESGIDPARGWQLTPTAPEAILESPPVDFPALVSPFFVVQLHGLEQLPEQGRLELQWTGSEVPSWSEQARVRIPTRSDRQLAGADYLTAKLHEHPLWSGRITGLRLVIRRAEGAPLAVRGLHTAIDSRHPITGSLMVQGVSDLYRWSGNQGFMKRLLPRLRRAIDFSIREFAVDEHAAVLVPWVGHDGRSGIVYVDGTKQLRPGVGVGNNYWDLMPFGHLDCLASIYLYDALVRMVELEELAGRLEDVEPPAADRTAERLGELAERLRSGIQQRFWNAQDGRFVACIDADGQSHDYGYTFLNLEAIYYGVASPEQAAAIFDWLDGQRLIEGDTSTGEDIYFWEFAPRATTKRNIDWYMWAWAAPESIPWGGQVQDGGAVLGFSYHDLMARIRTQGPDAAWSRLQPILAWYQRVVEAGGPRAYYDGSRPGSLQGCGTPGGLGIDCEFYESVLLPQTVLYGFLGVEPTVEGLRIAPRLPSDWPSLEGPRVQFRDWLIDISATADQVTIATERAGRRPLRVQVDQGPWQRRSPAESGGVWVIERGR